jgi:23S rRNA pseudouridine2605 synthase
MASERRETGLHRLQKVLARAGIASRRAAEELIVSGRVRVDGRIVTELGTKVDPRQARVEVDGRRITREASVYIVLHKPRGTVSTMHDPEGRATVRDLIADVPGRVYPVGRLDFNTSGVLFATNDGDFAEALMHPRKAVPKTYVVKAQGKMQTGDLDPWRKGIVLEDGKTLPAKAKLLRQEADKTWFELTITEGRNQQVRRMGEATGFRIMRLARTSFAGVSSEGLRPGQWRHLTVDELSTLKKEYGVPRRVVSPPVEVAAVHTHALARKRPLDRSVDRQDGWPPEKAPARGRPVTDGRGERTPAHRRASTGGLPRAPSRSTDRGLVPRASEERKARRRELPEAIRGGATPRSEGNRDKAAGSQPVRRSSRRGAAPPASTGTRRPSR